MSHLQKKVFLLVAVLALGDIFLEVLGTRFYYGGTLYKLGPVFVEEIFELTMTSVILYILTLSAFKLSSFPPKH